MKDQIFYLHLIRLSLREIHLLPLKKAIPSADGVRTAEDVGPYEQSRNSFCRRGEDLYPIVGRFFAAAQWGKIPKWGR